ncbi:BamA/TamA family outer membrane protein [Marinilabilia sp.]|uniref:BamA/TamA family outer membrane protein n=1 Tax=Marinilabilia sp. TaxID=2021252 RepID=UPI0025C4EA9B|nr:BamA/TamA family outer membrane protein [Marinilabilia sp.]
MIMSRFFRLSLVVMVFIWVNGPIHSQNVSVSEPLTNDSLAEAGGIAGLGEKVLDLVTWERGDVVYTFYPSISVSPRNGFVYGVMPAIKWNSSRKGKFNTIAINLEHSTKGMLQLQFEHEWYFHSSWLTTGESFVNSREDQYWLGGTDEEFYFDRKEFRIEWDFLNNLLPSLWIGGGILLNNNRFDTFTRRVFAEEQFVGSDGGWILGIGPKLVFDTRHRTLSPQRGSWLTFYPLFAGVAGAGDYNYQRYTFDGRQYFSLKEDVATLAFQLVMDYAHDEIPFFEEPYLGGKERLRGIGHPLKETDNAVWLARAEVRHHLWWRFGVVAFAGAGQAGSHFKKPFSDLISSVGGGLRFRMLPDDPLNVRFDFGASSIGTTGFFISLKEAF